MKTKKDLLFDYADAVSSKARAEFFGIDDPEVEKTVTRLRTKLEKLGYTDLEHLTWTAIDYGESVLSYAAIEEEIEKLA